MTVDQLVTLTREQSKGVSTDNVSNATIAGYLTIARNKVISAIARNKHIPMNRDIFTADTVLGQSEYTLQGATSAVEGIVDVFDVEVKRNDNDDYHSLIERGESRNYQRKSRDRLLAETSESQGYWEYRNGSIFLTPAPSDAVTNGLKIYGLHTLVDLATGGAESTIFSDLSFLRINHDILALGAVPWVLRNRLGANDPEVIAAQNNFEIEVSKLIANLVSIHAPTVIVDPTQNSFVSWITS